MFTKFKKKTSLINIYGWQMEKKVKKKKIAMQQALVAEFKTIYNVKNTTKKWTRNAFYCSN